MHRPCLALALALVLTATTSVAQGPYPSSRPLATSQPAMHRAGAAASSDGTTEATLAPVRRARGDCALDGVGAACGVSPLLLTGN